MKWGGMKGGGETAMQEKEVAYENLNKGKVGELSNPITTDIHYPVTKKAHKARPGEIKVADGAAGATVIVRSLLQGPMRSPWEPGLREGERHARAHAPGISPSPACYTNACFLA